MKKNLQTQYISTIFCMILLVGCASNNVSVPDFKTSVRQHLDTVENRDLEALKNTLTETNDLNVIFPGGSILDNTQAVINFHQDWFTDENWIFKTEIVKVIEGTTQSTALVKYNFQDSADTEPRQAWLVLTFQLEKNSWRLIHDQNTRIDKAE